MQNPSAQDRLVKIGEAAKLAGVSIDTLRRWEIAGKITPVRTPGGTRLYSLAQIERVINPITVQPASSSLGIAETADKLGVSTKTLRRWDVAGKLPAERGENGQRKYSLENINGLIPKTASEPINYGSITDHQLSIPLPSWIKKAVLVSTFIAVVITTGLTAGYLSSPQKTFSLTNPISTQGEVLGIQSDAEDLVAKIISLLLSPFDQLSQKVVALLSPETAKDLGFANSDQQIEIISGEIAKVSEQIDQTQTKLNSLDSELTATSESLNSSLNSLVFDGSTETSSANLIQNSSFEANTSGQPNKWFYLNNSDNTNTFVNNASIRSGNMALRFEPKDGATSFGIYQPSALTSLNHKYTLSMFVRNESDQTPVLKISYWDRDKGERALSKEFILDKNRDWQRYSFTLEPPNQGVTGANFYPMIEILNLSSGNIFLDDIDLSEGTALSYFDIQSQYLGDGSVFVTSQGHIYPLTNQTGSIGLDNLRFGSLYLTSGSVDDNGNAIFTGDLTIGDNTRLSGDLNVDGGDITSTVSHFNLLNSSVTTLNIGHGATSVSIGAATGTTTINNNLVVTGTQSGGGAISLPDGTYSTPALNFTNDPDSGLYRLSANSIGLITGGSATSGITIDGSGRLGVGTISPSYTADIVGTLNASGATTLGSTLNVTGDTTLSADLDVASHAAVGSGASVTDGFIYNIAETNTALAGESVAEYPGTFLGGLRLHLQVNPASQPTLTAYSGLQITNDVTTSSFSTFPIVQGADIVARNMNSGTIGSVIGVQGSAQNNSTGTVTSAQAVISRTANWSSGTITNSYGLYSFVWANAGTITNRYGAYIANGAGTVVDSGTLANNYGLYLENQTKGGTVDYGLYIAGADTNPIWVDTDNVRFDEFLSVNTNATPAYGLDIGAATATSRTVNVAQSGAKTAADYGLYVANTSTSSTGSINKYGQYISSTGTWNGASAVNYGLYVDTPTGGTTNWAAYFGGDITIAAGADFLAQGSNTDIGSAGTRFGVIYANEVNATTLTGTNDLANFSSATITINSDAPNGDTEDSNLAFARGQGTPTPNAVLGWDSTNDEFDLNSSVHLTGTTSLATAPLFAIQTAAAHTTGDIFDLTATYTPTAGGTQSGVDINLTNSPTSSANTLRGIDLALTDGTALANTLYGTYSTVDNSANTSTGAHSIYGGYFSATGKTAGTTTAYGLFATASGADTNYPIYVQNTATDGTVAFFDGGGSDIQMINVGDGNALRLVSPWNAGGTGAGGAAFDIRTTYANANYTGINVGTTNNIIFTTSDTVSAQTRMTILGGTGSTRGYVGIGTTSPARPLHIVGDTPLRLDNSAVSTNNNIELYRGGVASGTIGNDTTNLFITADGAGAAVGVTIDGKAAGQISIGATSTGDILLGGGSASTGCTVTNSNGNLTCTGNITGSSSGTAGFWTRTGTTLTTATADDLVSLDSNLLFKKEVDHTIQISDSTTADTAGAAFTIKSAAGVGTGNGGALALTSGAAGASGTGGAINITGGSGTLGGTAAGAVTIAGGQGGAGGQTGAALTLYGGNGSLGGYFTLAGTNATTTGSPPTSTITTGNAGSNGTGGGLSISLGTGNSAGGGGAFNLTSGQGGATGAGGAVSITSGAGGSTSGGSGAITINTGSVVSGTPGVINIGTANTQTINLGLTGSGSSSIVMSGGSADTGCTLDGSTGNLTCSGNITGSSSGTAGFWSRSGTTLSTATAGDSISLAPSTSTGTTTSAGFVVNTSSLTSGTGSYFTSSSITTGKLADFTTTGNTQTSGTLLNVSSTATSLTGTSTTGGGLLGNLSWAPGSSSTATGDLFRLHIGPNGTTTGYLFNIVDDTSSLFAISETAFTTSLPTNFTSPGDVAIAYDLNFTNPTASYIKSIAPMHIVAGETFNSSNLTLQTYNQGTVVVDSAATTGTSMNLLSNSLTTGTGFLINTSAATTGSALSVVGPTSTGVTTGASSGYVKVASDVGSAGTSGVLVYLAPDFSAGSATTGYGLYNAATDATAIANTDYGYYGSLTLTGNAAKTGYGIYQTVTSTSTTADTTYGADFLADHNGAISTGTKTVYGVRAQATSDTPTDTGGTINTYGGYFVATGAAGGGSTAYGIYAAASGADTNYAAFLSGNLGFATGGALDSTTTVGAGQNDLTITATDYLVLNAGYKIQILDEILTDGNNFIVTPGTTTDIVFNLDGDTDFQLTSTSTATNNLVNLSTNSITTGEIFDITATYAPTDGSTNEAIDINLTHSPTSSADNFRGIETTITDGTALANSIYGTFTTVALSGNAAKIAVGNYSTVTSSSTTADTTYSVYASTSVTGAISTGNRQNFGVYSVPTQTGANSGGTSQIFGGYFNPNITGSSTGSTVEVYGAYLTHTGTLTTAGTINEYGLYIANGTSSTTGTSTKYGLYVESPTGADTNYAAIFAGGNVGIGETTPDANLHVLSTSGSTMALFENNSVNGALITVKSTDTGGREWGLLSNGSGSSAAGTVSLYDVAANVRALTATSTGDVGIGDNSPSARLEVGDGTDSLQVSSVGDLTFVDANGAASITGPAGGALSISGGSGQALNLDSGTTGAVNIGTGANAKTVTIGNATSTTALAFNSGTGSQTHTSQVVTGTTTTSGFVFDATAITSGTGSYFTSDSITTGKLADFTTTGNTQTSGTLLNVSSTATSLTGTSTTGGGLLGNLSWVPGSSSTATGDLFRLHIGPNGSTSGYLFNIVDDTSSIFSISESAVTTSLPTNFTSSGDVAIAYDLNFTNQTASYIKSNAPLYIEAGEIFENNDLTFRTFGTGTVVVDQSIATTGSPTAFKINAGAHTTLTASTEATDINFNLNRTVQFATGALTNQRAVQISAPTYGFVGASTLTNAATVYVDRAPQAGTNATITNAYSFWVDAGTTRLDGLTWIGSTGRASDGAFANAQMADMGLTISQGTNDDQILSFKSSDVAHGITTNTETDTFASLSKRSATAGGLQLRGSSEITEALFLEGFNTTDDTTKTSSAVAPVMLNPSLKSGTTVGNNGANANLVAIRTFGTTTHVFDREGDIWLAGDIESLGGTEIAINESSADVDFRVESNDTTHMFFIDAGLNTASFGGTAVNSTALVLQHNITATADTVGKELWVGATLTGAADQNIYGAHFSTGFTEAGSGTHALIANSFFDGSTITDGAGGTTTAATVYIDAAMAGATNNYALFVDAGTSRFDGAVAYGSQVAMAESDATPDVSAGSFFITHATGVTVTDFDAGAGTLANGQIIYVESGGATVYDVTSSGLSGGGADFTTAAGDLTAWIYDGTDWKLINWVEQADTQSGGADLAEWYVSSDNLEPGDVVTINDTQDVVVRKSGEKYDDQVMGIVATDPGIILGQQEVNTYPIALAGRVPVKVSTENGPIQRGDYLTTSSTPGVAMKAIRPGPTLGKAMQEFSGSNIGQITVFVNVSYADPGNFLASLSMDEEGNLILPNIKTEKLVVSGKITADSAEVLGEDTSYFDLNGKVTSLEEIIQLQKEQLEASEIRLADLEQKIAANATVIASDSAAISELASSSAQVATSSAVADNELELTPPELLLATGSATLADLTVTSTAQIDGELTAYDLTVSNDLKSFGTSTLGNTVIAGDLTIDGMFSITEGNTINAFPTLYLQTSSLAELIDIFNGLITMDNEGKVTVQTINAKEYQAEAGKSVGTGTIAAGSKSVIINTSLVKSNSRILVTPTTEVATPLAVIIKVEGTSFTVSLPANTTTEVEFDWFIINESN